MAKMKKRTRSFKESQCDHCKLADKKALHNGQTDYCGYKKKEREDPKIMNGLCWARVPMKKGDSK